MTAGDLDLPSVIGHRGAAGHAPENTLAGIKRAAALGATWVELDVALTKDGEPVLLHDETVDRTTDAKGKLADLTLAEIRSLDAGARFSSSFAGERVPMLEEAIVEIASLGLNANVEIKPTSGREAATGRVVAERVAALWPQDRPPPLFSSFQPEALAAARRAAPDLPLGLLLRRPGQGWRQWAEELACRSIHCNHRNLDRRTAERMLKAGYRLLAYTVNDAGRAERLFNWGVDAVFSDYPDRILAM